MCLKIILLPNNSNNINILSILCIHLIHFLKSLTDPGNCLVMLQIIIYKIGVEHYTNTQTTNYTPHLINNYITNII